MGKGEETPDPEGLVLAEHDEDALRVDPAYSQDGLAVSHPAYRTKCTEGILRTRAGARVTQCAQSQTDNAHATPTTSNQARGCALTGVKRPLWFRCALE